MNRLFLGQFKLQEPRLISNLMEVTPQLSSYALNLFALQNSKNQQINCGFLLREPCHGLQRCSSTIFDPKLVAGKVNKPTMQHQNQIVGESHYSAEKNITDTFDPTPDTTDPRGGVSCITCKGSVKFKNTEN